MEKKIVHKITIQVWCSSAIAKEAWAVLATVNLVLAADFSFIVCESDTVILCDVFRTM